ncbi:MAG TPA: farnesyl diphosphate synthase [Gemmataceae bacterium]|nr:farnesyl diphosphate synthase [Gemmataceae bacterium]
MDLTHRRALVDAGLRSWLDRVSTGAPPALAEAMAYSLLAPGKRLRPLLTVLAAEATGATTEAAVPAACAVEMVHTYSLIHDDLPAMDDDDLRRGLPTCHKKYGEALAILAGDALLTAAFEVLTQGYPPRTAAVSCLELARGAGAAGMVAGQVLDLAAEGKVPIAHLARTANDLEEIHRRKTGALFLASLRLGLLAAEGELPDGPDPAAQGALDRFGRAFGLAFQIADDLLDVQGSSERTGKRVGKDAARGKLTFPGLLGVDESRRRVRELYAEAAEAADALGPPARPLADLARSLTERDR